MVTIEVDGSLAPVAPPVALEQSFQMGTGGLRWGVNADGDVVHLKNFG